MINSKQTNEIHPTAKIGENVIIGQYNKIGKNVIIEGFKGGHGAVVIGDCNIINDNTRILAGEGGIKIGDWNVFHNNMLVMGEEEMLIGHNCWFGQNTILDASGGLQIGNGVRIGMYSQVWTHVASGELIEGCTLFGMRKTIIEDDVWLVGSCIVSSGITIGYRGIFLIGSNITKSTESNKVYAGSPAKIMEKLNFYQPISLDEKFTLIKGWANEFIQKNDDLILNELDDSFEIYSSSNDEKVIICKTSKNLKGKNISIFILDSKKYTKTLIDLERNFYRFIFNHKARFLPE